MKQRLLLTLVLYLSLAGGLWAQSNALHFDGTDDYVTCPAINPTHFTVEAWVNTSVSGKNQTILSTLNETERTGMELILKSNNTIEISYYNGGTTINYLRYAMASSIVDEWFHFAATYNGSTLAMYINGIQITSKPEGSLQAGTSALTIGRRSAASAGNENYFTGKIDEVRVWDVARSQNKIAANTGKNLAGNETGLLAYYKFDQGTANGSNTGLTTLTDITANAKNGTLAGFGLAGTTSNWVDGLKTSFHHALAFDGSDDYVTCPAINPTEFTLEAWIYPTALGKEQVIVSTLNETAFTGMELGLDASNKPVATVGNGSTLSKITGNSAVTLNTWVHIAAVKRNNTIVLYVNGNPLKFSALTNYKQGSQNLTIGRRSVGTNALYFTGKIDEVRVWKTGNIVASQISKEIDASLAANEIDLAAYYKFDQGIANSTNNYVYNLIDASQKGNTGTLTYFGLSGSTSNWVEGLPFLTASPITLKLEAEAGSSGTINIESNTDWTISGIPDWLQLSTTSGSNNSTLTLSSLSANSKATERTANLTLTGSGVATPLTLSLTQAASLVRTWTGATNTDWNTTSNWAEGIVPTADNDVVIPKVTNLPVISTTTSANCNNITVAPDASLTIAASATSTGSLIVHGTSTGEVNVQSYLTGNAWHVVAPVAAGQNINTFAQNTDNAIPNKTGNYGMADYDVSLNKWKDYFTAATTDKLAAGKGYLLRRSTDGIVTYTGTIVSGPASVSLNTSGEGWNCIGNPYISAIGMNASATSTANFLTENASNLHNIDASYACAYLWDDASKSYKIIGNADFGSRNLGQNEIAMGQGFFVKAASGATNVVFNSNMQMHQSTLRVKAAKVSWPTIQLNIAKDESSASTTIAFNEQMTNGLDVTYDAGLLRGTSGLNLYSRLVDDNGVDFAIQCLPQKYDNLVVPLGVECKAGDKLTFSAETFELPSNCNVILEDKATKTFTSLDNGGSYTATVNAGSTGTGRFYLHTSSLSTITDVPSQNADNVVNAYAKGKVIYITGSKLSGSDAKLYDISGRSINTYKLTTDGTVTLDESSLVNGVYVLHITSSGKAYAFKVILKD